MKVPKVRLGVIGWLLTAGTAFWLLYKTTAKAKSVVKPRELPSGDPSSATEEAAQASESGLAGPRAIPEAARAAATAPEAPAEVAEERPVLNPFKKRQPSPYIVRGRRDAAGSLDDILPDPDLEEADDESFESQIGEEVEEGEEEEEEEEDA